MTSFDTTIQLILRTYNNYTKLNNNNNNNNNNDNDNNNNIS